MKDEDGLTPRQRRFAEEYIIDLNGKQAAIRTGYSAKTSEAQASRLLRDVNVSRVVAKLQAKASEDAGITAAEVIRELAKLAKSNMMDYIAIGANGDPYFDFSGLTREQAASIQELVVDDYVDGRGEDARDVKRIKFRLADKKGALDTLAKHFGLLKDQVEHSGKVDVTTPADPVDIAKRIAFLLSAGLKKKATENRDGSKS